MTRLISTSSALREPSSFELAILRGLQNKQVYQGTVPGHVKAQRRAANKRARLARRGNGQTVKGHTTAQRARRYAHLENIARRANHVYATRDAA